MAFRALLFSKNSETSSAITVACQGAGIRAEVCSDIFTAIEKAKTQTFSCIIADWAEQPEASFLLKRARESVSNRDTVAIAIADNEPTSAEVRDNRLDFLIYRPISSEEAEAVLGKAAERMKPSGAEDPAESLAPNRTRSDASATISENSETSEHSQQGQASGFEESTARDEEHIESTTGVYQGDDSGDHRQGIGLRGICAAGLTLMAVFFVWRSRDAIEYLSRTPEGTVRVLRESVAALFYLNQSGALPVSSAGSDAQQDAYFSRVPVKSGAQNPALAVAATASTLTDLPVSLPKAPEFPLPVPVFERQAPPPVHRERAAIPESMRNSPSIAPPVVVTVNPAQMMPISSPQPQAAIQQFSEPVAVSEEAARGMLVHSVDPVYPPEGLAQKLHGPVVLQALIGRDGGVEDLKIVRGYFILGRAAIAAVKQWRFQPYTLNGHAAATQTVITVNFSAPPG
jgi:protein TonB